MRVKPDPRPFRLTLGERGEMAAWAFLIKRGYKILEKNYRCPLGEIDCIAEKKGRLVFLEVKTRSSEHYGRPEEAVDAVKQRKLLKLAQWYLKEKSKAEASVSFAVVAVERFPSGESGVRLIEDAFQAGEGFV